MGTTVVTQAGDGGIVSQDYQKTVIYGAGNSNQAAQEVKTLLHISGSRGLVYDAAGGALTNSSTGAKNASNYIGLIKPTLANEIRYSGGNPIHNLIANSKALSTIGQVGKTGDGNVTSDGTSMVAYVVSSGTAYRYFTFVPEAKHTYEVSIIAKDIVNTILTPIWCSVASTTYQNTIPLDSRMARHGIRFTSSDGANITLRLGLGSTETGQHSITITDLSIVDITGLTAELREYVANGYEVYNSGLTTKKYFPHRQYSLVVGIGDSITASTYSFLLIINQINEYTATLNKGIGGNTLSAIAARFTTDCIDEQANIVIIEGGINDIITANSNVVANLQSALISMVEAATTAGITVILVNLMPFKGNVNWTEGRQSYHTAYNEWLANYARDNGILFYDAYSDLVDPNTPETGLSTYYEADYLHPSIHGHDVLGFGLSQIIPVPGKVLLSPPPAIMHEPSSENLALLPRELTNAAYVKVGCTAAKTATGTDGVINSASTLTATAANATCLQTVTSTSAERITGAFIKRRTGTGDIEMTQDDGSTWTPVTVPAEWGAAPLTIPAATLADPVFGFRIVTSGDAIDVDWVQHELGAYITSPISGSRTIDSHSVPLVANVNFQQAKGIAFGKLTMQFANSATAKSLLCTSSAATDFIHDNGSGEIAINDGTNTATTVGLGGWAAGDVIHFAGVWIANQMSIHASKNGGAWVNSANATYDGAFPAGANFLLCNANTDSILINSLKIKSTTKSSADAQAWAKNAAVYEAV